MTQIQYLDRTLSYQEHLRKVVRKIQSRNKLYWLDLAGARMPIPRQYRALCYPIAEYCAQPDRALLTPTLSTALCHALHFWHCSFNPVLVSIEPSALRRMAGRDRLLNQV